MEISSSLPPPISPFVAISDIDKAVINVMNVEIAIIINVCPFNYSHFNMLYHYIEFVLIYVQIPERATTHEMRRKSITPQMLNMFRMRTPSIHPNLSRTGSSSALGESFGSDGYVSLY